MMRLKLYISMAVIGPESHLVMLGESLVVPLSGVARVVLGGAARPVNDVSACKLSAVPPQTRRALVRT